MLKRFIMISLFFFAIFFSPLHFASENKSSNIHFLTLADIHFDPFYTCQNTVPCPIIEKLRQAPAEQWSALLTKYDALGPQYKQDANYPLLQSMLQAAKKTANNKNAQFILILGDFLSHDYRDFYKKYANDPTMDSYQNFVRKTFSFLNQEIAKTFPNKDIYAVVGNNDSYQDDYVSNPNGQFFRDLSSMWGAFIKNKDNRQRMEKSFIDAGYYAVIPQPELRLIVLNTNLFSAKAKGRNIDQSAQEQLKWLHEQLQTAKEKNQKVMIAMHIPMGIDIYSSLKIKFLSLIEFWQPQYKSQFESELKQFSTEVIGLFAGHIHADWFQILKLDGIHVIPVIGTPSVSPIFGNNPGFKLFTYSTSSKQLENFVTYYYPLTQQNGWYKEYDFSMIYQSNCRQCPILQGMDLLKRDGILSQYYKHFYAVSTEAQPITSNWDPYYWCAIRAVDADPYGKCLAEV